jgi:hypothetical protein
MKICGKCHTASGNDVTYCYLHQPVTSQIFASSQVTPLKVTAAFKDNGGQNPEGILLEEFERELKNDQMHECG